MLLTVFGSGALNIDPKITGQKRILMFIIGIFFFVLLFLKLISLFKRTRMIIVNKNEMLGKRKNVRIELKTDKKKQKIALNIETKSVKEFIEFITSKIPATH